MFRASCAVLPERSKARVLSSVYGACVTSVESNPKICNAERRSFERKSVKSLKSSSSLVSSKKSKSEAGDDRCAMTSSTTPFTISNTTRGREPRVAYGAIKDAVLGSSYELSLVFAGETVSRRLNRTYRAIDRPASVLSFPLDKNSGEIIICPQYVKRRVRAFGIPYRDLIGFLFIHGMLHLKGMEHGSRMEQRERVLCEQFSLAYPER